MCEVIGPCSSTVSIWICSPRVGRSSFAMSVMAALISTLRGCSGCLRANGEQMLDQLGAALGGIVDQARGALQLRLLLQARHQRLGIAGDHRQHVVEVVRDAAGQLADRVELLRLVQLPLGLARRGRVVIDQHRAGDRALPVAHRPAADHEMARRTAVVRADDHLQIFELLAAQHARGRQLVGLERRDAVAVEDVGQRAQIAQVHAGAMQQHALRGRIGQQDVALGVDHQHRLRHAAERALEHVDRQAQLVMRGDEVLGAFGDGRLEHFLFGLRLVQRALELHRWCAGSRAGAWRPAAGSPARR